jgi:hypothetical protein
MSNRFKYSKQGKKNTKAKEAGKIRKLVIFVLVLLLAIQPVQADIREDVRQKGLQYAKPLEVIMVDGPMYVKDDPYYIAEYVESDSRISASLVYRLSSSTFISDPEIIRKLLATKDIKKLIGADPLFYGVGDPAQIIEASKYETQNARNFASFASITPEERNILEVYLKDYENVMNKVANVSAITQKILYPDDALKITYQISQPAIDVKLKEGFSGGHFSYEGFENLVASYETLYHDYRKLSADLAAFAGGLPEYQPGAIIREKFEVQITKEGILDEVRLIEENGNQIKSDIDLRKDILSYHYDEQIMEAQKRLGKSQPASTTGIISIITKAIMKIKTLVLGLIGLGAFLFITGKRRPPKQLYIFLIGFILTGLLAPSISHSIVIENIPTMDELISQKVTANENIPYSNIASELSDSNVEELLYGFRLVLKGESVEVRGPYTHYKKPYYYFDVKKDGSSTGNGFLVDAEKLRLVGDQRQAFQLLKTLLYTDLLKKNPLYIGSEPELIQQQATATLKSPLDIFLTNLSLNMREGIALEEELIENPDFEILLNLTNHYVEAYILMQNINQLVSAKEANKLTGNFSDRRFLLEAHSRATRGLSTPGYLLGRMAQYRGRTLNRLPLIRQLSLMGLRPSKAQVAHDLTSDLVYDNIYLWRIGRTTNPNLFARLAFREGTYTLPESAVNLNFNSSN